MRMTATDQRERRENSRVSIDSRVQLRLQGEVRQARLLDISEGGLRIGASGRLAAHAHVTIFLPVPKRNGGKRRLHLANGSVVWSDGKRGAGIRFDDLPDDVLWDIREYVAGQRAHDFEHTRRGRQR